MIHREQISFDNGEKGFLLVDREHYEKSHHYFYWLAAAIIFVSLLIAQCVENATPVLISGVVMGIGFVVLGIICDRNNAAYTRKIRKDDNELKWNTQSLQINDVQRVDTTTTTTKSKSSGGGVGVHLGYGLMVGGGGFEASSVSTDSTVVGWQLYTSIGVIVITDEVYNEWLNAGKPNEVQFAVKSNWK